MDPASKVLLLLLVAIVIAPAQTKAQICSTANDCPQGYSCIFNSCAKCLPCSSIYRKGNETCLVHFNECGDCLKGYEEIDVTDFSDVIKPCQRKKFIECSESQNCPSNYYCTGGSCVECFDCDAMNRLNKTECTEGVQECGSCMPGYKSPKTFGMCYLEDLTIHDMTEYNMMREFLNIMLCIGYATFIGILMYLGNKVYKKTVSKQTSASIGKQNVRPKEFRELQVWTENELRQIDNILKQHENTKNRRFSLDNRTGMNNEVADDTQTVNNKLSDYLQKFKESEVMISQQLHEKIQTLYQVEDDTQTVNNKLSDYLQKFKESEVMISQQLDKRMQALLLQQPVVEKTDVSFVP